jgi:hypothetical protein
MSLLEILSVIIHPAVFIIPTGKRRFLRFNWVESYVRNIEI